MNITIRQLEAFVAVAECASFTRAADRLHIAQPALSILIRDLERELGVRLLNRTTRRIELTDAGREFKQSSHKILDDLIVAARNASDLAEYKRGRLVIAASPLLAAALIPGVVSELQAAYPKITVGLIDAPTDVILQKVRSGEATCGLGTFSNDEEALQRVRIAQDNLVVFCHQDCPLAQAKSVQWRDVEKYDLVALTRESRIRLLMEFGFETAGLRARPVFEVSQSMTALALVEAGLGVAILPASAASQTRASHVKTIPLVKPIVQRDISLIRAADRAPPPAFDVLMPILIKHARRHSGASSSRKT